MTSTSKSTISATMHVGMYRAGQETLGLGMEESEANAALLALMRHERVRS